jgi:hypothetical protein
MPPKALSPLANPPSQSPRWTSCRPGRVGHRRPSVYPVTATGEPGWWQHGVPRIWHVENGRCRQSESSLEHPVRHALLPLEKFEDLRQDRIIVHHRPSTPARAASVAGSQKIMSISRYISRAVDSAARACSGCPVWLYNVPRPR